MMLFEMVLSWRLAPSSGPQYVSQLFKRARVWCKQYPVSGVLLFDGECLMGHFEAPKPALRQMLDAYRHDPRHTQVKLQYLHPIARRSYDAFRAGYVSTELVASEPDSSLTPLTVLRGDHAKIAFRQLHPELD